MGPTCLSVSTCLNNKKYNELVLGQNEKVKKKKKPLILNAEFTEKENYTELLDMLH